MTTNGLKLTLLIPTYNEGDIIAKTLSEIASGIGQKLASQTEVLIVDDGTDNLPDVAARSAAQLTFAEVKVLRNAVKLGKGLSLARGFQNAQGEIAGFLDADLSTPPRYIPIAVDLIDSDKADIFIGSRRVSGAHVEREQSKMKDVLGNGLQVVARTMIFLGMPVYYDTQCGFKFFKTPMAKILYQDLVAPDGMTDIEVLLKANLLNYRVSEQGVEWSDLRESKRPLKDIIVGEVWSVLKILKRYKLGAATQRRRLQELSAQSASPVRKI